MKAAAQPSFAVLSGRFYWCESEVRYCSQHLIDETATPLKRAHITMKVLFWLKYFWQYQISSCSVPQRTPWYGGTPRSTN